MEDEKQTPGGGGRAMVKAPQAAVTSHEHLTTEPPELSRPDGPQMGQQAAYYASRFGWRVFPIRPGDKRPLIKDWEKLATTDNAQIGRWWRKSPGANIGVPCGPSGLVVVDLDVKNGLDGIETWHQLKTERGFDDSTVTSRTPSGGMHLLFSANGHRVRNSTGRLGPGVDVRGEGGYIVLPPSRLEDGGEYVWDAALHPADREPAPFPCELAALLVDGISARAAEGPAAAGDRILAGTRNNALASLAGTMRRRGMKEQEITAALLEVNRNRCEPPLDESEVRQIAKSVARYQPGLHCGTDTVPADAVRAMKAPSSAREVSQLSLPRGLLDALTRGSKVSVSLHADEVRAAKLMGRTALKTTIRQAQQTGPRPASATAARASHLPRIDARNRDLPVITQEAWDAIHVANKGDPFLFRYGGLATRIELDDLGTPITRHVNQDRMRHILARAADWYVVTKAGPVPELPPMHVVRDVLATPDPPLPILTGIVETPVFAPDGTLQSHPGYQPKSLTYYRPAAGLIIPLVPESPSPADVKRAKELILEDLLGDFPFTGEAERAHALALLLLPFARRMIPGATPLHLIEKPSPGTGGTLLVQVMLMPTAGRPVSAMTEGRCEEEWRKRLTAKLLNSPPAIFIDNLHQTLDSSALSSAITTPFWEDRILGMSVIARVPVQCVWVATGNNPSLSNEMARRSIRIRIDARVDQPWLRKGFRHPNLPQWAEHHRADLVWASLTIIENWIVEGRPMGEPILGMFEEWSAVMGGILDTAGIPGFLMNLEDFYKQADLADVAWPALVELWWERYGDRETGVGQLFTLLPSLEVGLELGSGSEQSQKVSLGKLLAQQRDRRFLLPVRGSDIIVSITLCGTKQRANKWRLQPE